jgi:hypothetical protein
LLIFSLLKKYLFIKKYGIINFSTQKGSIMSDPACNWLRIRNERVLGGLIATFALAWNDESQTELGQIGFESSSSFDLRNFNIPEGASCWVISSITGGSESNFTYSATSPYTAVYNLGSGGFSLNIESNQ